MPLSTPEIVIGDIVKLVQKGAAVDDAIKASMPALRDLVRYRAERPGKLAEMWASGKSTKDMAAELGLTQARVRELAKDLPMLARLESQASEHKELADKIFAAMREGQTISSLVSTLGISRYKIDQAIAWAGKHAARIREIEYKQKRREIREQELAHKRR